MAQQTFSGVPGDFSAGQVLTAADMDKLREFLLYLIKDGDEGDTGEVSPLILDLGNDRVGIGTDSPSGALDIEDATNAYIYLNDSGGTVGAHTNTQLIFQAGGATAGVVGFVGTTSGLMRLENEDGPIYIETVSADKIYIRPNGSTAMTIDQNLDVGIGLATPAARLHVVAPDGWDSAEYALRVDNLETTAAQGNGIQVQAGSGAGSSYPMFLWDNSSGACMYVRDDAKVHVYGVFSKSSGSFDIPHPTKGGDWRLRHSFIEGPQADNLYRGTVTLTGGTATVDLDAVSNMTAGTWEALNRDPWSMVASSGNIVEWSLSGKTLTITSDTADAVCTWIVIGERQDDHMKSAQGSLADDDGHLIVEYEEAQPVPPPPPDTEDTADAGPPLDG